MGLLKHVHFEPFCKRKPGALIADEQFAASNQLSKPHEAVAKIESFNRSNVSYEVLILTIQPYKDAVLAVG